ncbi:uncharacterized protein LOC106468193 [Limulus polyphemus]|uniref:Uncharacterized protein LOC106468193 n=1 Tax=Limulus polyphemus TaxID=6850 RepID=A0ABM1BKX9_LIMPO|nr:uncharacterized protein LOC106468193 [Limulus polyphemus]XP_022252219.1 uncharacterized protein LOC106468193 [Limulus polyphemus]
MMATGRLPPVQRVGASQFDVTEKEEWKKLLQIQQHLSVTALRSSVFKPNFTINDKKTITKTVETEFNTRRLCCSVTSLFGDQKIFLKSCEALERLAKVLQGDFYVSAEPAWVSESENLVKLTENEIKHITQLHCQLKTLLTKRCFSGIRRECILCMRKALKFKLETEMIALSEWKKLLCVNSGVTGNINLHLCYTPDWMREVDSQVNMWLSLLRTANRMLGIVYLQWEPALENLLTSTSRFLSKLVNEILHWVQHILSIDLILLCQMEIFWLTSDILHVLFQSFERLSKLQTEFYKTVSPIASVVCLERPYCELCKKDAISFSNVFILLATQQAQLSAKKVASYLVFQVKKNKPEKVSSSSKSKTVDTSDYCSAEGSEVNKLESYTKRETGENQSEKLGKDLVVSVSSVLHTITHCSQTLLLKFLFAFSCAQTSQSYLDTLIEGQHSTKLPVMRKKWQKIQNNSGTESCTEMEHSYWKEYWKQFGNQLLLYLTNAQPHEMEIPDRIDIWIFPKNLVFPLIQDLKETKEEKELNTETIHVVNDVYWVLVWETCLSQWQHRIFQFLVASQQSRFSAVPLESEGVSSDPGNIVFRALEELFFYIKEMKVQQLESYSVACVTAVQLLKATLDQFLVWSRQKLEATLTSWKVCEYLLIGCSDIKRVCHLLDSVKNIIDSLNSKQTNRPGTTLCLTLNKELDDQIQRLKVIEMHIAEWFLIQCSNVTVSIFKESSQSVKMWRKNKTTTKGVGSYINEIILEILKPTVETLSLLPVSSQADIVRATIKAIIQAWQSYMYSCKICFSVAGGLQLKQDLQYICNWMWKSSLNCQVIEEVMTCEKLLKFSALTDFLATPEHRKVPLISRQNHVVPVSLEIGSMSILSESNQGRLPIKDLSEEEKEQWRPLKKKSTTVCGWCTFY